MFSKPRFFSTLFCLFFIFFKTFSQSYLNGIIVAKKGDPIAFVALIPNEMVTKGVMTDINGRFSMEKPVESLTIRCVGMNGFISALERV
jgi:hypothetical protein